MRKYELLAPAGSFESLVAGISARCDAVYLGGEEFSARKKASNFSREELKEAVVYAHLRGVKVYVAINTLLTDSETEDALEYIEYLLSINVDAFIIQSIGLANVIKNRFPQAEIHASTQMAIINSIAAKNMRDFGFNRVVLARETETSEIEKINELGIEIEGFIHGALCVSLSGECLMSSMIGGRSGNRGDCAQACRKRYTILNSKREVISDNLYHLSPKDLISYSTVEELISKGVYSLKIEGRMKNPQYVYGVVSSYRDALENRESVNVENIAQLFNRGFTRGLAFGSRGEDFLSYDRPDNRGVEVGEVVSKKSDGYILKFNREVFPKDGLEFILQDGKKKITINFSANKNEEVFYSTTNKFKIGSKIMRYYSSNLDSEIKKSISKEKTYRDISIYGEFKKNSVPKLVGITGNFTETITGDFLVEEAKNAPLTEEKIRENISKLGGTVYNLVDIKLEVDEDIFIPIGKLNSLRRDLVEKLNESILNSYSKNSLPSSEVVLNREPLENSYKLNVEVYNREILKKLDLNLVDKLYIHIDDLDSKLLEELKVYENLEVVGKFPKIETPEEHLKRVEKIKSLGIKSIYADNLGQVCIQGVNLYGNIGLNIYSAYDANYFRSIGFSTLNLSEELTLEQTKGIIKKIGGSIEKTVYGNIPVMTLVNDPLELYGKSSKDLHYLRDTKNIDFPFRSRGNYTEIFNSYPIVLIDKIDRLKKGGICEFKLIFNVDEENCNEILKSYYHVLKGKDFNTDEFIEKNFGGNFTYGHLQRGIN